ncbi:nucleosome-binding factor SPN subunit POB3 [Tubulinosema ratisbonensis]|uniref:Nucleosome-binding factor SPN subunit POB3 n=1 Tax=Tubulinosema ratisbonensis TaxID=291195 RepID=A0A437AIL0_9MICR|nr:nucleosome-binding factor SPN subunit POB3 [Tubulinosema ratisbonensis]
MEEVITVENVFLNGLSSTLKISSLGLALKDSTGKVTTIKKESINKADIFFGLTNLSLRINEEVTITGLEIDMEQKIKDIISHLYSVNVRVIELDITDPINGTLIVNKNFLSFLDKKVKFEIPIHAVESVYVHKNDSSLTLQGKKNYFVNEIVFHTVTELELNSKSKELIIFEEIQTLSPKVKNNYVFFKEYLKIVGPSNNIKILFSDIFFAIQIKDTLSLKVSPFRIGETSYEFLALKFDDSLVDFEVEGKKYEGKIGECFLSLLLSLTNDLSLIQSDKSGYRCVNKALEGNLFLLPEGLFFLPKPIFIPLKDISLVEFSRAYYSSTTSKTIDLKVMTDHFTYKFDGISKDCFNELEVFFGDNNIKARSEVLVEDVSEKVSESVYESESEEDSELNEEDLEEESDE